MSSFAPGNSHYYLEQTGPVNFCVMRKLPGREAELVDVYRRKATAEKEIARLNQTKGACNV